MTWTESLAVGSETFIDEVQSLLGIKARNRKVVVRGEKYILQETTTRYNVHFDAKNSALSTDNRLLWDSF